MIKNELKEDIVKYAKWMDEKGMGNSYEGNISIRDGNLLYITPSQTRKSNLTVDLVAVIDLETGEQVDGAKKPSSELPMHIASYKARPDAGAVIHAHSPYLFAYAMCHKPIDVKCSHELLGLFKKIPVAKYGRAGTDKIYEDAVVLLKTYDCVLLANHGSLLVASDLDTAFARMEAAEGMARMFTIIPSIGTPIDLPEEEIKFFTELDPNGGKAKI